MALPDDKVLSHIKYSDHWRPDSEAETLWNKYFYEWFKPPGSDIKLNVKILKNPDATDAVLIVTGFNEPMAKYVQTAYELFSQGNISVVLYDHRGQGLSDKDPALPEKAKQNGHFESFDEECVADCLAVAAHASNTLFASSDESSGKRGELHVLAHSMGGLITTHALAAAMTTSGTWGPFTGRVVLSCPMFETYWGDVPALSMPRAVSAQVGSWGTWLGAAHYLPPAPGAKLSWWDPHQPIKGVCLTHDPAKLVWYWALRSMHPAVALAGPSMGWIREMTGAQAKTGERVAAAVTKRRAAAVAASAVAAAATRNRSSAPPVDQGSCLLSFPPTLVFTAEHDMLVQECGQRAFVDTVITSSEANSISSSSSGSGGGGGACIIVRALIQGSYHEPLFEQESIRQPVTRAAVAWLTDDTDTSSSSSSRPTSEASDVQAWTERHASLSSLPGGGSTLLRVVQSSAPEHTAAVSKAAAANLKSKTISTALLLAGVVSLSATVVIAVRRRRH